jgi:hypothetical protein
LNHDGHDVNTGKIKFDFPSWYSLCRCGELAFLCGFAPLRENLLTLKQKKKGRIDFHTKTLAGAAGFEPASLRVRTVDGSG